MSGPIIDSTNMRQEITSKQQLIDHIASGEKPREKWRIGTEHEKFPFLTDSLKPVPYEGARSIKALLQGLQERFSWLPILEGNNLIALNHPKGLGTISLEPGGQFELSGAPLASIHETSAEIDEHLAQVHTIGNALGIGFLGLGFSPMWQREETPIMPKGRYKIMSSYMDKRGKLGRDMMLRTATVQVNLDFSDEADMVKKLRVSLALQPIATALFANSPFREGQPSGYQSWRSAVWLDTDPDRTGMLPFAFKDGMGYEAYVDYALNVPMYFVYRDGIYHDVSGASFKDFLQGKLEKFPNLRPTISDWADHLTIIFPEVRLKSYLEMRGADTGSRNHLCALSALWTGLFYDRDALEGAYDLIKGWTEEERQKLRTDVPILALDAQLGRRTARAIAKDMLALSRSGLERRAIKGPKQASEAYFLETLEEAIANNHTNAQDLLRLFQTDWQGDITRVFRDCAY